MVQSGIYRALGTLFIRRGAVRLCPAFNLTLGRSMLLFVRIFLQCLAGKSMQVSFSSMPSCTLFVALSDEQRMLIFVNKLLTYL